MADESTSSVAPEAAQPPRHDGAHAMAAALVERGTWTQEQADAALAAPDAEPAEVGSPAPAVTAARDALELQGALISANVDQTAARFVGEMFRKAATNPPSAEARAATSAENQQYLRDMWGEHFETMLGVAQREMLELARGFPKLPALLESTGLGDSPFLIRQLAQRGIERAKARRLGLA
jgi:hypothetical protein